MNQKSRYQSITRQWFVTGTTLTPFDYLVLLSSFSRRIYNFVGTEAARRY